MEWIFKKYLNRVNCINENGRFCGEETEERNERDIDVILGKKDNIIVKL